MKCMKCGRETGQDQLFCDSCSAEMKKYPVSPDTVVQLPNSKLRQPVKKSAARRRPASDPEQLRQLTHRVHLLRVALGVALALLIVLSCVSIRLAAKSRRPLPGQNYSTVSQKSSSAGN